ncbi:MAG: hypothetical protein IT373_32470 [Polyangiaceae bacterium]|nr:hypothetical protein [Polyangiaceae bacterium]
MGHGAALALLCLAAACGGAPAAGLAKRSPSVLPRVPARIRLVNHMPADYRWQRVAFALDHGPTDTVDFGRRLFPGDELVLLDGSLSAGDHSLALTVELTATGDWNAYSGLAVTFAPQRLATSASHDFALAPDEAYRLDAIVFEANGSGAAARDTEPAVRFEERDR